MPPIDLPFVLAAADIAELFGFHWSKFLSQLVVFVVVYFILAKYAFGPVTTILAARKKEIAESLDNALKIKSDLAAAEKSKKEIVEKAHAEAKQIIEEARKSNAVLLEQGKQTAIKEAEQIILRAREATIIERDMEMAKLRGEVGRLVIDITSKVTDKVLTAEDRIRLNQESLRQMAA